ncbi:hypothetical protein MmiHf6_15090 [Methanimicrococcus hongohii]|uniref:FeoB-associated Cys-rich membrane protein n=1 Tax=Methanimicrococcus hongohii TaxID=3028295 RepID=A0AA96V2J6_9EURY|nr:hypothetical protein MmiHf6_15090 [Methanimicrococcus sp. Hf6]
MAEQSLQKKILKYSVFAILFGVILSIWMYSRSRKNQNCKQNCKREKGES